MNASAVRAGVLAVADKVAEALERDLFPLVIGGDCTVELGTVLGWQRHRSETSLLYFDAHPDLNTPDSAWAEERGAFLVHFDTDSIDMTDLPLAENTDRNVGLSFEAVANALDVLLASPQLGALTITEINPHHGEPDGATLRTFLDRFVMAFRSQALPR
jgi:arginase family enzyme